VRWLTDSEKYNEWMNPIDYETEEAVEAHERKVRCPFGFRSFVTASRVALNFLCTSFALCRCVERIR